MTTERDIRNQIRYAERKGMEKGMEKGMTQQAINTARRMLEDNVPVETIVKYSGLTEEQIAAL